MILPVLTLLGLGVADLARWSPERVTPARAAFAWAGGTLAIVAVGALSGLGAADMVAACGGASVVLAGWCLFDGGRLVEERPGVPLAWLASGVVVSFLLMGSFDPVEGPLADWYQGLPAGFATGSVDAFALAVAGGVFLLATANRLVRLTLQAAGTPASRGEARLRGGRLLGPMERLIVAGLVIGGQPAGAALVIAAKGLLRLPEIREATDERASGGEVVDGQGTADVTEYFLIGTFASLIVAAVVGLVVLAAG